MEFSCLGDNQAVLQKGQCVVLGTYLPFLIFHPYKGWWMFISYWQSTLIYNTCCLRWTQWIAAWFLQALFIPILDDTELSRWIMFRLGHNERYSFIQCIVMHVTLFFFLFSPPEKRTNPILPPPLSHKPKPNLHCMEISVLCVSFCLSDGRWVRNNNGILLVFIQGLMMCFLCSWNQW